jgi:hypothetical protein
VKFFLAVSVRISLLVAAVVVASGLAVAAPAAAVHPSIRTLTAHTDASGPGSISGVVVKSGTSTGLAGVVVDAFDSDGDQVASVTSNGSGAYSIPNLAAGDYTLDYIGTGYYISQWSGDAATQDDATAVTVTAAANTAANASLVLGGSISGTLTGSVSTAPVAGVVVTLEDLSENVLASTTSDSSGVYSFRGVAAGTYYLDYNPPIPYVSESWNGELDGEDAPDPISVVAGATTPASMVLTQEFSTISGTVTSAATGQPISGISVDAYSGDTLGLNQTATTDASGNWSISELVGDADYTLKFSDPSGVYAATWWQNSSLQSNANLIGGTGGSGFDVSLSPAASISGTVIASNTSAALSGVEVHAYDADGNQVGFTHTNGAGHFSFGGLAAGSYTIKYSSIAGYAGQWWSGQAFAANAASVTVTAGGSATANATLSALVGTISGTVTSAEPLAPVAGVGVVVYNAAGDTVGDTTTNSAGTYSVGNLPVGSYKLQYVYDGSAGLVGQWSGGAAWFDTASTVAVSANTVTTANATLAEQGTITGVITGADTGQPLTQVAIDVTDAEGNEMAFVYDDDSGSYTVGSLPAGTYTLAVEYLGSGSYIDQQLADSITVTVAADGTTTRNIVLQVPESASISGVVKGADTGTGVSGIQVQAFTSGGEYDGVVEGTAITDSHGGYSITGLSPGSYSIEFTDPASKYGGQWWNGQALRSSAAVIQLVTGTAATANATLALGATISGSVSDIRNSAPLYKADVEVFDASGNPVGYAQTNSSGAYAVHGLPAGNYTVEFSDSGYFVNWWAGQTSEGSATVITLAAGGTASASAALTTTSGSIYGTVVGSDLVTPVQGSSVTAYDSYGLAAGSAETDSSGDYSLTLQPGTYTLYIAGAGAYYGQWWHGKTSQGTADSVLVTSGGSSQANAALAVGGTISGTVSVANFAGRLSGVQIEAFDASGNQVGDAATDASGDYSIEGLSPGSYTLEYLPWYLYRSQWWGGVQKSSAVPITLSAGGSFTANVTLQAVFSTITGTVYDPNTGRGVPNVQVLAQTDNSSVNGVFTDSEGHYVINGVPAGNYTLEFFPWSGDYPIAWWPNVEDQADATTIAVGQGTTVTANETLAQYGGIAGSFTAADTGFGLSHVEVDLFTTDGTFVADSPATSSDSYDFGGLAPGAYKVQFSYDGDFNYVGEWWNGKTSQGTADTVTVTGGQTATANAVIGIGGTISGVVHGADHPTLGVANVEVDAYDSDGDFVSSAQTDSSGDYKLSGLQTGNYRLDFDGAGTNYLGQWWNNKDSLDDATALAVVAGSGSTANATLAVGATVAGVVTDAGTHAAVANVEVDVYDASGDDLAQGTSNSSGHYSVGGLATGSYYVQFSDQGVYPAQWWNDGSSTQTAIALTVGTTTTANFALAPGGTIAGVVKSADHNTGLPDIDVTVFDQNDDYVIDETTSGSGHYSIGGLAPGTYTLQFLDEDGNYGSQWWSGHGVESAADHITVQAKTTTTANATMALGGQISGVVDGADTSGPLADVEVDAYDSDGTDVASTSTQADGTYSFGGLSAGNYTVHFEDQDARGYASQWYSGQVEQSTAGHVAVTAGGTATANANLAVGGTISGTVTASSGGADLASVEVEAYAADGTELGSTYTEDSGTYSIAGVPAGSVKVQFLYQGDGNYAPQWWNNKTSLATADSLQVTANGTSTANAALGAGSTISGTVTASDTGNPLENVDVTVDDATGTQVGEYETDSTGTYSIDSLAAGNYTVHFAYDGLAGYQSQWWNGKTSAGTADVVQLTAGSTATLSPALAKTVVLAKLTTAVPTITGTAKFGQTLAAQSGTWGPGTVSLTYQWNRDGSAISAATSSTYLLGSDDIGHHITVTVTGNESGYQSASTTSAASATVVAATFAPTTASITGTAVVGGTLTANVAAWTPTPDTITYQWRRNGVAISGQTASTYVIANSDLGTSLTVVVTGSASGYTPLALTSAAVAVPKYLTTTPIPSITGIAIVGNTLTATAGAWSPAGVAFSYQWSRSSDRGCGVIDVCACLR